MEVSVNHIDGRIASKITSYRCLSIQIFPVDNSRYGDRYDHIAAIGTGE